MCNYGVASRLVTLESTSGCVALLEFQQLETVEATRWLLLTIELI